MSEAETKICSKCKTENSLQSDFTFRTDSKTWRGQCKECISDCVRERRKDPTVRAREKERLAEFKQKYPEKFRTQRTKHSMRWRRKYPEKWKALVEKHKTKRYESTKRWYAKNPHYKNEYARLYRKKMRELPPELQATIKTLNQLIKAIKEYGKEQN